MFSARTPRLLLGRVTTFLPAALAAFVAFDSSAVALASVDLSITDARQSAAPIAPGTQISVDLVIHNSDVCPTCNPLRISYWDDSVDGNVNCEDGAQITVPADLTGESDTSVPVVLNGYPRPGHYRAWFWVDCQQDVSDPDQSNNKRSLDIIVPSGEDAASGTPDQVGGSEPTPTDSTSNPPQSTGFCGLFAGQSTLSAAVIPTLCLVGLMGLKSRRNW